VKSTENERHHPLLHQADIPYYLLSFSFLQLQPQVV